MGVLDLKSLRDADGQLRLSKEHINMLALRCIADYNPEALKTPMPVMAEEIAEIHLGYDLRYEYLTHNESILGTIAFNAGTIPVYDPKRHDVKYINVKAKTMLFDRALTSQRGRAEFSIAHEVGHAVMHPPGIVDYGNINGIITCRNTAAELNVSMPNFSRVTPLGRREWQADYFAACLKLPKIPVITYARECLRKEGHGMGIVRVMNKNDYKLAELLWTKTANFFVTSNQAARIRLQELQIIRGLNQDNGFKR